MIGCGSSRFVVELFLFYDYIEFFFFVSLVFLVVRWENFVCSAVRFIRVGGSGRGVRVIV